MSRHRRERVPQHRAQRLAENPDRRVRVNAAVAAARTALATTRRPGSDVADTAPLAQLTDDAAPRSGTAGPDPPDARRAGWPAIARGATRGLIATPWFAAGTGFVLAAALWIHSPHAELRLPSGAVGQPCAQVSCAAVASPGTGSLAITTPGVPIPHAHKHAKTSRQGTDTTSGRAASAGLTFTFQVLWQRHGTFDAMISVTGHRPPGHWQLAFQLPGDSITYVMGANWLPSPGGAGGVASALTGRAGQPGHGPGGPGAGYASPHGVEFMVVGSGTPATPVGCFYNGASCTFTAGPPPGARPPGP
jgi:hypothetical protein